LQQENGGGELYIQLSRQGFFAYLFAICQGDQPVAPDIEVYAEEVFAQQGVDARIGKGGVFHRQAVGAAFLVEVEQQVLALALGLGHVFVQVEKAEQKVVGQFGCVRWRGEQGKRKQEG